MSRDTKGISADERIDIKDERSYSFAIRTIEEGKQPSRILCFIMSALEKYRQSRKMGWSRPQNKYGLNVFSSFELRPEGEDRDQLSKLKCFLEKSVGKLSFNNDFIRDLFDDTELMGFVFCHDYKDNAGDLYEGFTVSLGRKCKSNRRFRDRLDLVFESSLSQVQAGKYFSTKKLNRIRVYVDPYLEPLKTNPGELFVIDETGDDWEEATKIYNDFINALLKWGSETYGSRIWNHWTSKYISYFGPRKINVFDSIFNPHRNSVVENDVVQRVG